MPRWEKLKQIVTKRYPLPRYVQRAEHARYRCQSQYDMTILKCLSTREFMRKKDGKLLPSGTTPHACTLDVPIEEVRSINSKTNTA